MSSGSVAVIDIGSNTIKALVARRMADGSVAEIAMRTLDVRISTGLSGLRPELTAEGMERGVEAVRELVSFALSQRPEHVVLVATSAVRESVNGEVFRERVRAATGIAVRVLAGDEEAALIGRGLRCDPALETLEDYYVFDLGGGSLECLAFRARQLRQAASYPLGCVRLTERFAGNSSGPLPPDAIRQIAAHVRRTLGDDGFRFDLPDASAIFAGGTLTVARVILGAGAGRSIDETSPRIAAVDLRDLLHRLAPLSIEERRRVPGLPAARADVFPTAIATVLAVADVAGVESFQHSFYNLRWGVAAEALLPVTSDQ